MGFTILFKVLLEIMCEFPKIFICYWKEVYTSINSVLQAGLLEILFPFIFYCRSLSWLYSTVLIWVHFICFILWYWLYFLSLHTVVSFMCSHEMCIVVLLACILVYINCAIDLIFPFFPQIIVLLNYLYVFVFRSASLLLTST